MWIYEEFTATAAKEYYGFFAEKIKTQGNTEITFKETNDFFVTDEKSGVCISNINK
jgi:hypothetical protein